MGNSLSRSSSDVGKRKKKRMKIEENGSVPSVSQSQFILRYGSDSNQKPDSRYKLMRRTHQSYANVKRDVQNAIAVPFQGLGYDLSNGQRITRHAALAFAQGLESKRLGRSLENGLNEIKEDDDDATLTQMSRNEKSLSMFDIFERCDETRHDSPTFEEREAKDKNAIRNDDSNDSAISLQFDGTDTMSLNAPSSYQNLISDERPHMDLMVVNGVNNIVKTPGNPLSTWYSKGVARVYNSGVIETWVENSRERSDSCTSSSSTDTVKNAEPSFDTEGSDISSISCSRRYRPQKFSNDVVSLKLGDSKTNFTTVLTIGNKNDLDEFMQKQMAPPTLLSTQNLNREFRMSASGVHSDGINSNVRRYLEELDVLKSEDSEPTVQTNYLIGDACSEQTNAKGNELKMEAKPSQCFNNDLTNERSFASKSNDRIATDNKNRTSEKIRNLQNIILNPETPYKNVAKERKNSDIREQTASKVLETIPSNDHKEETDFINVEGSGQVLSDVFFPPPPPPSFLNLLNETSEVDRYTMANVTESEAIIKRHEIEDVTVPMTYSELIKLNAAKIPNNTANQQAVFTVVKEDSVQSPVMISKPDHDTAPKFYKRPISTPVKQRSKRPDSSSGFTSNIDVKEEHGGVSQATQEEQQNARRSVSDIRRMMEETAKQNSQMDNENRYRNAQSKF